jgi:multidrug efflux pump subunit AcrA (membrane-fusion protein)
MNRVLFAFCVCLFLGQLASQPVSGFQDAKPEKETAAEDKPADKQDKKKEIETVEITVKPIKVFDSFEGRFESTQMQEITTDFKSWSELKIKNVVEEGSVVTKGQVLIEFDPEKLDKAIAEAEFAVRNSEFDFSDAQLAMQEVTRTFELDTAIAERTWKNAQEDHEYYRAVSAPERLKDLDYDEKTAGYRVEYAKDELDQLEQMYTEDELTEESEEIVLKRARRDVESAERFMARQLLQIERERKTEIPRDNLRQEDQLQRASLEYEKSKITLPVKKQRTEISLAKSEFEVQNNKQKLEELKADRDKMSLMSQSNGMVYFGKCVRGKWTGVSGSESRRLEVGDKVPADKVVMTVVDAGQLMIRADLEESKLGDVQPRLRGNALVKAAEDAVIPVTVKSVSRVPLGDGKFDCQLVPQLPGNLQVMPGMTCKMSFLVYENAQAVVAPSKSVFSDDEEVSHYVYVVDGEATQRREVRVGRKSGDDIEILDGLAKGDKIAKDKP